MQHAPRVGGVNWKTLWMQHRWHMHSQDKFTSTQQAVINNCVSRELKKTLTTAWRLNTSNYYCKCKTHKVCFNQCPKDKAKVAQLWKTYFPGRAHTEKKWLWRKKIIEKKRKLQGPSQCKCRLPFSNRHGVTSASTHNQELITNMKGPHQTGAVHEHIWLQRQPPVQSCFHYNKKNIFT